MKLSTGYLLAIASVAEAEKNTENDHMVKRRASHANMRSYATKFDKNCLVVNRLSRQAGGGSPQIGTVVVCRPLFIKCHICKPPL